MTSDQITTPFQPLVSTLIGSLPKPAELVDLRLAQAEGRPVDTARLAELTFQTMVENVREQRARGIDIVVSGEPDRVGSFHHVSATATGFGGLSGPWFPADLAAYPEVARAVYPPGWMRAPRPACTGPIALRDGEAVFRDIDVFLRALTLNGVLPGQAVMTEPSPGILSSTIDDHYYHDREKYLAALVPVLHRRYRAIIEAGLQLQVDSPDLLLDRHARYAQLSVEQWLEVAQQNVAALNDAIADLPLSQVRVHACWGNYRGPDTHDVELRDALFYLEEILAGTLCLEASLPVHRNDFWGEIEWMLDWEEVQEAPPAQTFILGVVDPKYPSCEPASAIAQHLVDLYDTLEGRLVGACPDCGFELASPEGSLPPQIAWLKIERLGEGVRAANEKLAQYRCGFPTRF